LKRDQQDDWKTINKLNFLHLCELNFGFLIDVFEDVAELFLRQDFFLKNLKIFSEMMLNERMWQLEADFLLE